MIHALGDSILSYPVLSCPILSYPVLSRPILSYPILSYMYIPGWYIPPATRPDPQNAYTRLHLSIYVEYGWWLPELDSAKRRALGALHRYVAPHSHAPRIDRRADDHGMRRRRDLRLLLKFLDLLLSLRTVTRSGIDQ